MVGLPVLWADHSPLRGWETRRLLLGIRTERWFSRGRGVAIASTKIARVHHVRARGYYASGASNGSASVVESVRNVYLALVVICLAVGIWGIPVTVSLVRGGEKAYRNALLVLLLGTISAGIQMGVSQSVRGASAPVNMRFFITLFTMTIFLLLRLPPVWQRVDFTQPMRGGSTGASAGTALTMCGIITLTTPLWAGPTHLSPLGENWVSVLQTPLLVGGSGMMLAGLLLLLAAVGQARKRQRQLALMGRRA